MEPAGHDVLTPDPRAWQHAVGTHPASAEAARREAETQRKARETPADEQPGFPDDGQPRVEPDPLRR